MPKITRQHKVLHRAEEMYALVADVSAYPEFLPMCESLTICSRRQKGETEIIIADMTVAYKIVRETFTSRILLRPGNLTIDVSYVDGPFRYLDNLWRFEDRAEGGSNINFNIDYAFKNRALGLLMGSMFELAFSRFTTAFEDRANAIYGVPA